MGKRDSISHLPQTREKALRAKKGAVADDLDVRITPDDLQKYPQIAAVIARAARRPR